MELNFAGKRALITGAGKGIGRGIAKCLAQCGAETVALSRTQADLDSLKKEVPGIETVCVDLADWDATRQAVKNVGRVDLLVNNAGVTALAPFLDFDQEDFDRVLNINLKSVFNVSQVVARGMVDRGTGGSIVNVSSLCSKLALPGHTAYCTSKAGLDMLTNVMALELGKHQIRVNTVNPTIVLTDMGKFAWSDPAKAQPMLDRIPLNKFVETSDVANAVLFLLSDKASMINGTHLPIEGGFSVS